jgi:hypothetical protein
MVALFAAANANRRTVLLNLKLRRWNDAVCNFLLRLYIYTGNITSNTTLSACVSFDLSPVVPLADVATGT